MGKYHVEKSKGGRSVEVTDDFGRLVYARSSSDPVPDSAVEAGIDMYESQSPARTERTYDSETGDWS